MKISDMDKKIMYSLYQNDNALTYKSIADLYKPKYKDINEGKVDYIVNQCYSNDDSVIDFNSELIRPVKIVAERFNMQATRNNNNKNNK